MIVGGIGSDKDRIGQRAWMRREGDFWTIVHGDSVLHVRDGKGLHYLAALAGHPGVEIHAGDLVSADAAGRLAAARAGPHAGATAGELHATGGLGDAGAVLDETAKSAYASAWRSCARRSRKRTPSTIPSAPRAPGRSWTSSSASWRRRSA